MWCDGVFLTALKAGHWVLLDELNLAPQVRERAGRERRERETACES